MTFCESQCIINSFFKIFFVEFRCIGMESLIRCNLHHNIRFDCIRLTQILRTASESSRHIRSLKNSQRCDIQEFPYTFNLFINLSWKIRQHKIVSKVLIINFFENNPLLFQFLIGLEFHNQCIVSLL